MAVPERATATRPGRTDNWILSALSDAERARLQPALERVSLRARDILFDVDRPIEHVYFPREGCVVSIVSLTPDGSAVETATVGREGMVGLPVFLEADHATARAFCQMAGDAFRLRADVLRRELASGGKLRSLLGRYTQAYITQVAQTSACNRLHTMRERCARWLLHVHDRVGADQFALTQRFLSQMLGVRRATVTEAAQALHQAGLIDYVHGHVVIRDRCGLERASCQCYAIIRRDCERLLLGPTPPTALGEARLSAAGD